MKMESRDYVDSLFAIKKICNSLINGSRLFLSLFHFALRPQLFVGRTVCNEANSREDIFISSARFHIYKKRNSEKCKVLCSIMFFMFFV
jgi:hypothetical protein